MFHLQVLVYTLRSSLGLTHWCQMTCGMHIYNTQKYIFKLTLVDFHCMKETLVLQSKMVLQELLVIDNTL